MMRNLSTKLSISYKFINGDHVYNFLNKPTSCFRDVFNRDIKNIENSILTLKDFLTEETGKYSEKYFEILSIIFKVEIKYLNENEIEIKGFKSKFHLKVFLTLYRYLFELLEYNKDNLNDNIKKRLEYFNDLCNSDFKKLDHLQQLLTSFNLSKVYMGNHCIKSNYPTSDVRILSIEEFHNMNIPDNTSLGNFFCYLK